MGNMGWDIVLIACLSCALLFIVLLILTIVLWRRINRIQRKYDAMIGHAGVANLEEVIVELQSRMNIIQGSNTEHELLIKQMSSRLSEMKGNVSMLRYNAFSESGSDQSFSIAIVDDHQDGLVLTVIHGREETYSYGKPLTKGESKYPLSPEELKVISSAQNKLQNRV